MTDWDLMTPGIGLTSIGIVGVGISLSGIAKTFIDGMHAVTLLTMFIGMIFLASGLLKDGFPTSGRAKSVTVSTQVPSIFAYIGLMLIISIPATVLAVASYRGAQYLKPLAVIFVSAAIVGGSTFYAFGVVTPKPSVPAEEEQEAPPPAAEPAARPANTISARILPGASAEGNPDYDPDPLSVNQGDGVEWTNEDNTPHTVSSKQEGLFDSGIIDAAAKWLLNTADLQPAEYEYYCTLHPFMGATLVVTGSSAANQTAGNTTTAGAAANQMAPNTRAASPLVTSVSIANGASLPTNEEFYAPDV